MWEFISLLSSKCPLVFVQIYKHRTNDLRSMNHNNRRIILLQILVSI